MLHEEISGQAREPLAHGGAQAVRDLLPENGDAGLFQRIDEAAGRAEREVEQRSQEQRLLGNRAVGQMVDEVLQDERRCDIHGDIGRDDEQQRDEQQRIAAQDGESDITHGNPPPFQGKRAAAGTLPGSVALAGRRGAGRRHTARTRRYGRRP